GVGLRAPRDAKVITVRESDEPLGRASVKAFRVLAYVIAADVVVQAAAIAFGVFGESKYVDDNHTVTKALVEAHDTSIFTGAVGFAIHQINGTAVIPLLALALVIASFFAKVPGGTNAALLVLLFVVIQIVLGIFAHSVVYLGPLHAINAFLVIWFALAAARRAGGTFLTGRSEPTAPAAA
ncbi:MAG: hypothetical protein QOE64_724, partial [Frankiales bacterium]|nr:hypothetical protein [Frankiales bacterium]